jgi:hypothetical protein
MPGAVLVSILESVELIGEPAELDWPAGAMFVSALLDVSGIGDDELWVMPGVVIAGADEVSVGAIVVAGAMPGVDAVLVSVGALVIGAAVVSVEVAVESADLLQPPSVRAARSGRARMGRFFIGSVWVKMTEIAPGVIARRITFQEWQRSCQKQVEKKIR